MSMSLLDTGVCLYHFWILGYVYVIVGYWGMSISFLDTGMWLQRRVVNSPWTKLICIASVGILIYVWRSVYTLPNSTGTALSCIQDDDIFLDSCDLSVSQTEFLKMMNESATFIYPEGTVCHRLTDGVYVRCIRGDWVEFKAHIRKTRNTGAIEVPVKEK
ncbi:hypothetical protein Btru_025489 [Bulinus truncatus]|nr:hypothetical protein Btru_025489 [Bulinus truncatus]